MAIKLKGKLANLFTKNSDVVKTKSTVVQDGVKTTTSSKTTTDLKTGATNTRNTIKQSDGSLKTSGTVSHLGKTAIVTAGVTAGALGTATILKDTALFQDTAIPEQTVDPEEIISDEDKRSIIEEIITRLQGGNSGGTTAGIGGDGYGETSASTFSEALSTIKQYLPWILGAGIVLFIVSMSNTPDKAKAEAVPV